MTIVCSGNDSLGNNYIGNTMTQVTQEQIAQALMINYKADIIANIDRERHPSHELGLQLFAIDGVSRYAKLHMVYLPREGELVSFCLVALRVHHSVSNVQSYRNRVQYIQVSMDNKATTTDDGRKVIQNQNPYLFNDVFMPLTAVGTDGKTYNNPFNCVDVTGFLRLAPVPAVYNSGPHIEAYNKASEKIRSVHEQLKAQAIASGTDLGSNATYRAAIEKLYAEYQENMKALIADGTVQLAQVLNVADSSLIPAYKLDSSQTNNNPFLNAVGHLSNGISYMPTVNSFFGFARINSSATVDDINPQLTTGLRTLGKDDETTEESTSRAKRQEATRLAVINDSFGNGSSILVRRQDQGYVNPRNTNQLGLAEIFNNATQNDEGLFIRGTYLPIVATKDVGGNSNGILRGTVVIDEYTKQQSMSLSTSSSISSNAFENVSLDNVSELVGGTTFTAETESSGSALLTNVDTATTEKSALVSDASSAKAPANKSKSIL